jgi:hypothetical protein
LNNNFKIYEESQKLKILIKLKDQKTSEESKKNAEKLIQSKFNAWILKYFEKIKKLYFSFYDLGNLEIVYLTDGFDRTNYLRNANSYLERRLIYCLFSQNKLELE